MEEGRRKTTAKAGLRSDHRKSAIPHHDFNNSRFSHTGTLLPLFSFFSSCKHPSTSLIMGQHSAIWQGKLPSSARILTNLANSRQDMSTPGTSPPPLSTISLS